MNSTSLVAVLAKPRNGTDGYTRHPLNRRFLYTSGIREVADVAGAYWLLDVVATEVAPLVLKRFEDTGNALAFLVVRATGTKATLELVDDEDAPVEWSKRLSYSDFPAGVWTFAVAADQLVQPGQTSVVLYLLSEH